MSAGRWLFFDTGPVGWLANPAHARASTQYILDLTLAGWLPCLSSVVIFECGRELVRLGDNTSINALAVLAQTIQIDTPTHADWIEAANLWAHARKRGRATASRERLDADTVLAACVIDRDAVIVTTNRKHFEALGIDSDDITDWQTPA